MLHLIKMWLKVPVEEADERGGRRISGGKRATRGTPQGGVISPLLANIYMHRFLKAFRPVRARPEVRRADRQLRRRLRGAVSARGRTRSWRRCGAGSASIGLTLNEDKTCVRDARCESFDFLGYTFGPMYSPRTGGRYNGARPSKKAIAAIKGAIRRRLRNGNQAPWPEVVSRSNRTVRGWAAYFCYGSLAKGASRCAAFTCTIRCAAFSDGRHKLAGPGYRQFPVDGRIRGAGRLALDRLPRLAPAHAARETRPRAG